MSKKKKKRSTVNRSAYDVHHLLWQARFWNKGYGKLLREHEYMKKLIPRDTLHRFIHQEISNIPMPDGKFCKKAYFKINEYLEQGLISYDDSIEERLELLIECWKDDCPETVKLLKKEQQIVSQFYGRF